MENDKIKELIDKHLKFERTSVEFASVKYFAESGKISGELFLRLKNLINECAGQELETSEKAGLLADVIDWALVSDKQPPSDIEVMASDGVDVEFDKYGDRYSKEWNKLHYTYKFWAYKPKSPSL
jgi:hypothetical protein